METEKLLRVAKQKKNAAYFDDMITNTKTSCVYYFLILTEIILNYKDDRTTRAVHVT